MPTRPHCFRLLEVDGGTARMFLSIDSKNSTKEGSRPEHFHLQVASRRINVRTPATELRSVPGYRRVKIFESFTQGGELKEAGRANGLELLTREGPAQDFLCSDQQIEDAQRRRNDQDKAGQEHSLPRSSCQGCQRCSSNWNHLASAQRAGGLRPRRQLKWSGQNRQ